MLFNLRKKNALKTNQYSTTSRINKSFKYLIFHRVPVDNDRIQCLSTYIEGRFRRPSRSEPLRDPFTSTERRRLKVACLTIDNILRERGLTPLPNYPGLWEPPESK